MKVENSIGKGGEACESFLHKGVIFDTSHNSMTAKIDRKPVITQLNHGGRRLTLRYSAGEHTLEGTPTDYHLFVSNEPLAGRNLQIEMFKRNRGTPQITVERSGKLIQLNDAQKVKLVKDSIIKGITYEQTRLTAMKNPAATNAHARLEQMKTFLNAHFSKQKTV